MIEQIGIYDVKGFYIQDSRRGEQIGKVALYSDRKIIGQIRDILFLGSL